MSAKRLLGAVVSLSVVLLAAETVMAQRPTRPLRPETRPRPGQEQPQPFQSQPIPATPATPARPATPGQPTVDDVAELNKAMSQWEKQLPSRAADYASLNTAELTKAAQAVEFWAADVGMYEPDAPPATLLKTAEQLLEVKAKVDERLAAMLEQRTELAPLVTEKTGRDTARNYLRATSSMIDLSGRIRFILSDLLDDIAGDLADKAAPREQFIDLLCAKKSSVGADVMAIVLSDPPPDAPPGVKPVSLNAKLKLLQLIGDTGQAELLPEIVKVLRDVKSSPYLVLAAGVSIRATGLPQDPRPDQDQSLPRPAITARELNSIVTHVDPSRLNADWQKVRTDLLTWLAVRTKEGVTGDSFRMSGMDVQPGDWLLMRNPSPYNLFTDLSPGLFTHVGVVAAETGKDGIRRMVLVDLPERGSRMPATNLEIFVERTRHYLLLRHPDDAVAKKMGEAANSVIGNEALFDLNFRTDRVAELKDKPLKNKKINTYCAGFLLLCAQQTGSPREDFFPVPEFPAGGNFTKNLHELGMSIGDNFISPTGALFSTKLKIVGRREPMYEPTRVIEEAIFDHFATQMERSTLVQSPDTFQILRQKMAEASKHNPLLAKALAQAANVNENTDLVAGAKAGAVVETLDDIAYGASREFARARDAITAGPPTPEQIAKISREEAAIAHDLRKRHAELSKQWDADQLTPRELRIALVNYYVQQGRAQLDARFFNGSK